MVVPLSFPPTTQALVTTWPVVVGVEYPPSAQAAEVTWPEAAAPVGTAPTITSVELTPSSIVAGGVVTCTVVKTGPEPITVAYQWKLDGVDVGTNSSTYTTTAAGDLTCDVDATNAFGSDSATSNMIPVLIAPTITSVSISPSSLTVGDVATVSVTATGSAPIIYVYQWKLDGVDVGTNSTTYTTTDTGFLTCDVLVFNAFGSDTETATGVTVAPGSALVRTAGADVLSTASNYALPAASWTIIGAVELTGTNGIAPFDILSWDFVSGGGGLLIAFSTTTSPDRIRCQHTRAPATPVTGEVSTATGYEDLLTVGRFKFMVTYDGSTLRFRAAKGGVSILATPLNSAGAINLGSAGFPVIEMAEAVGKLSWAMGNVVLSDAQLLAADENSWDMPSTAIVAAGGTVTAGRVFNATTIASTANVDYIGSVLGADTATLVAGSARLTSEA
jgi:hypothetical protein